jgi:hypothetical protein
MPHLQACLTKHKDTHTQEVISPPTFSSSETDPPSAKRSSHENRATRLFRGRPRSNSGESGASGASGASSSPSRPGNTSAPKPPHGTRKISERFGLRKHEAGSSHVPSDLPEITVEAAAEDKARAEVQWEKRATILAQQNERSINRPGSSYGSSNNGASGGARNAVVASRNTDEDLQEGIRLHESGQFEEATKIFARLADPKGDNHALSQILYVSLPTSNSISAWPRSRLGSPSHQGLPTSSSDVVPCLPTVIYCSLFPVPVADRVYRVWL